MILHISARRLLFVAAFAFAALRLDAVECKPIAYVDTEFESAHVSMGRLKVAYPVFNLEAGAGADFGEYGYLLLSTWTESDLTNHYRDRRCQPIQEFDPLVLYGYDFKFADGWSLDSRLGAQWNLMTGYYGEDRRSYDEWQFRETLVTPYITLWYAMRNFYLPVTKASFRIGAKRSFPLNKQLSIVPMVWFDGGSDRWNVQRFGYTDGQERIDSGLNSCSLKLLFNYHLADYIDVYCGVMGYFVVDDDIRAELDANPSREAKSECVIFSTGLRFSL
jgi:hypothetical protein